MGKPNKEGLSALFYFPVFYMYIRKSAMSVLCHLASGA
jgi:hypothetical protein